MEQRYVIGLDYGSLSGRGVLVNVGDGAIAAQAVCEYRHGIISEAMPGGQPLPPNYFLQNPADYIEVLDAVIPQLMEQSGVCSSQVIGIGVDFTASTIIPVDENEEPLQWNRMYADRPEAWCRLWKDHAATEQAQQLTQVLAERDVVRLNRCGGKVSPESLAPKVMQIFAQAPDVFAAADHFEEAGDWIVSLLTGSPVRSKAFAACKALWTQESGYPDDSLFAAGQAGLAHFAEKLSGKGKTSVFCSPWERAGGLCRTMAERLGLCREIAVSAAQMDAHAAQPALGIVRAGQVVVIVGTSSGVLWQEEEEKDKSGLCSIVPDCDYPKLTGYAAGQCSVGDCFQWFMDYCVPADCVEQAVAQKQDLFEFLEQKAAVLVPGQSGLLALDWWNGNRSRLADPNLSGMILGLTLTTRPEEIYRALLEANAFGLAEILGAVDADEKTVLYVCGGIAGKNRLLMQMYADVTGCEVRVSGCTQAPALGSAIYAAVAAGSACGGYADMFTAVNRMSCHVYERYLPNAESGSVYAQLYAEYRRLSAYFGKEDNMVMKRLRALAEKVGAAHSNLL